MRDIEELIKVLGRSSQGQPEILRAQAELDLLIAQGYSELLEKTRETLDHILSDLNKGIGEFRQVISDAAVASEKTNRALVRWTTVLSIATVGLVLATVALVYVTWVSS
jgi:hypothetical protein